MVFEEKTGLQKCAISFFCLETCLLLLYLDSTGGPQEKRLLGSLLADYNTLNRPVLNESEALMLTFGVTLQQIIDVVS
jgi:hypothetical protein